MPITRYNAGSELQNLHNQMNRFFEPFLSRQSDEDLVSGTWVPPVDVIEDSDAIVVSAELPGMRQEDIEIQYENGALSIRGQRTLEKKSEGRSYHRVERAYGTFVRTFTLPRTANAEAISANYTNGVLEVRIPKREESKPKQIRISAK